MEIILAAVEKPLAAAWKRYCGDLDCVTIHEGSILDLNCDAVVSPANSFGFMDGGIDARYRQRFGDRLESALQQMIRERHHGELVVGTAEIVETRDTKIPFLIAAPTMRVPMILRDTVHPYLAARAVLLLVKFGRFRSGSFQDRPIADVVTSVAFPGLGTGIGRVPAELCARQVRAAIEDYLHGAFRMPTSWAEASERHQLLYTDHARNLQYPE